MIRGLRQRIGGFHGCNPGKGPSPTRWLARLLGLLEDRQVVIEVGHKNVSAVLTGGPVGITRIYGIVDVVEELRIDRVEGMRVGAGAIEVQVFFTRLPGRWLAVLRNARSPGHTLG